MEEASFYKSEWLEMIDNKELSSRQRIPQQILLSCEIQTVLAGGARSMFV